MKSVYTWRALKALQDIAKNFVFRKSFRLSQEYNVFRNVRKRFDGYRLACESGFVFRVPHALRVQGALQAF
jgi:hypothetical protein